MILFDKSFWSGSEFYVNYLSWNCFNKWENQWEYGSELGIEIRIMIRKEAS